LIKRFLRGSLFFLPLLGIPLVSKGLTLFALAFYSLPSFIIIDKLDHLLSCSKLLDLSFYLLIALQTLAIAWLIGGSSWRQALKRGLVFLVTFVLGSLGLMLTVLMIAGANMGGPGW
jgi:hypothetical protein